jgi:hypothetical protein
MTEVSPARAAYEASIKVIGAELGASWDDLPPVLRESWEAAAKAAVAATPVDLTDLADWVQLLRERDEARALIAEVRAILLEGGQDDATARRRAIAASAELDEERGDDDVFVRASACPVWPAAASHIAAALTAEETTPS